MNSAVLFAEDGDQSLMSVMSLKTEESRDCFMSQALPTEVSGELAELDPASMADPAPLPAYSSPAF